MLAVLLRRGTRAGAVPWPRGVAGDSSVLHGPARNPGAAERGFALSLLSRMCLKQIIHDGSTLKIAKQAFHLRLDDSYALLRIS